MPKRDEIIKVMQQSQFIGPNDPKSAGERARQERLYLAREDLFDVASAALFLADLIDNDTETVSLEVQFVLEAGIYTVYARAFNESRGNPPLPAAPTKGLTPEQREVHRAALNRRDRYDAHVDRDAEERQILYSTIRRRDASGEEIIESNARGMQHTHASAAELRALSNLAADLAKRYDLELLRLEGA